jgi:hypothetical protein
MLTTCAMVVSLPALGQHSGDAAEPLDEFGMTEAEAKRRAQSCAFPNPSSRMDFKAMIFDVVSLPDMHFVTLVEMHGDPTQGGTISPPPDVPEKMAYGDICGSAVVAGMGRETPGHEIHVSLRLRQGTDLEATYPKTFASPELEIGPAAAYMILPLDVPSPVAAMGIVRAFLQQQGDNEIFDASGKAFWARGLFFVPLSKTEADS